MPVLVGCPCGKKLRVPDEHAGKRVRCPVCGDPVSVPPRGAAAAAGMVRFRCGCGKAMQARAEYAGQTVECPACRADLVVPEADDLEAGTRVQASRPEPKAAPAGWAPAPRDGDDGLRVRKAPPVRKRALWPFVLAGAVLFVMLLGAGGVVAWRLVPRADKAGPTEAAAEAPAAPVSAPDPAALRKADEAAAALRKADEVAAGPGDLELVPVDAQGFVTVRVADVWKLDSTQRGLRQLKEQGLLAEDPVEAVRKATSLTPADVERATVVFADAQRDELWFTLATVKPYDRQAALGKLEGAREVRHEGKSYHLGKVQDGPEMALHFVGPRVLLLGPEVGVKRCLSTLPGAGKRKGPLGEALQLAGRKRHLVAAINPPPEAVRKLKQDLPKQLKGLHPLLDAEVATLSLVDLGTTTHLEIHGRYPDATKAADARKGVDGVKAVIQLIGLPALEEQLEHQGVPKDQREQTVKLLNRTLDETTVELKGRVLTVQLTLDNKGFEDLMRRQALPGGRPPLPKKK
jgi:hypothetical protein